MTADQCDRLSEEPGAFFFRVCLCGVCERALELVEVDANPAAVEPVAVAFACHGIAEQASRVPQCLVEAVAAALWILARPERFEDFVALRPLFLQAEECDEFERSGA